MALVNNIIDFGAGDLMSSVANYAQIWNVLSNAIEVDNDSLLKYLIRQDKAYLENILKYCEKIIIQNSEIIKQNDKILSKIGEKI